MYHFFSRSARKAVGGKLRKRLLYCHGFYRSGQSFSHFFYETIISGYEHNRNLKIACNKSIECPFTNGNVVKAYIDDGRTPRVRQYPEVATTGMISYKKYCIKCVIKPGHHTVFFQITGNKTCLRMQCVA